MSCMKYSEDILKLERLAVNMAPQLALERDKIVALEKQMGQRVIFCVRVISIKCIHEDRVFNKMY